MQIVPKLANHRTFTGTKRLGSSAKSYEARLYRPGIQIKNTSFTCRTPDILISSDFIVGFPGETDEEFAATMALVQDLGLINPLALFTASVQAPQPAYLPDDVSPEVKKQRLSILQTRLTQQATKLSESMLNTTQKVLVTGSSKRDGNMLSGRTDNNRVVNFSGPSMLIGQMHDVVITEVKANTLIGELTVSHLCLNET